MTMMTKTTNTKTTGYNRPCINNIQQLAKGIGNLPKVLDAMGFPSLRENQKDPINTVLAGRDTFAILATGGGKTALFAIPTMALEWKALVFSPLIALMRDQVKSLNKKGLRTAAINANNKPGQNAVILQDWLDDRLDVLFIAPERIDDEETMNALCNVKPDLVVLDEAHTMSQWATGFRPAYRKCGELVERIDPSVVLALTATATDEIINDVKSILHIEKCAVHWNYEPRLNLHLSSEYVDGDEDLKEKLLKKVRSIDGSVIVYADTIKHISMLSNFLANAGETVAFYHSKMRTCDRDINQDAFMRGSCRVMVATNAFGMGIDKADIRGIIHAYPPGSIEAISQETGRAARDGGQAECHMFYNNFFTQKFLAGMNFPGQNSVYSMYKLIEKKADNDGLVMATVQDLMEEAHMSASDGAEGALAYLNYIGCVERFESDKNICHFVFIGGTPKSNTHKKTLDTILKAGIPVGTNGMGEPKYELDISLVASMIPCSDNTVKNHLKAMDKEGIIIYTPPFTGKVTKVLRPPTDEEYRQADIRRGKELSKVTGVEQYCRCADKDKQQFLLDYFTLKKTKAE